VQAEVPFSSPCGHPHLKQAKADCNSPLALPCIHGEKEGSMWRERALKAVLVVVGLLFTAGVLPLTVFFSRALRCQ
jgi:hypothetical protein